MRRTLNALTTKIAGRMKHFFGQPNGAAKKNTERNRRMKRTLNALTTKIAGRVQPFLNIPTALMTALAFGGFGLSLWMVDDSMKDRAVIAHVVNCHNNHPLTHLHGSNSLSSAKYTAGDMNICVSAYYSLNGTSSPSSGAKYDVRADLGISATVRLLIMNANSNHKGSIFVGGVAETATETEYIHDSANPLKGYGTSVILYCYASTQYNDLTGKWETVWHATPPVSILEYADARSCATPSLHHKAKGNAYVAITNSSHAGEVRRSDAEAEHGVNASGGLFP